MAKMLLIDVENNCVKTVEASSLDDYYKFLNCSLVEMPTRMVKGNEYTFICDEEGTFVSRPIPSALTGLNPALVGNLLICNTDWEEGIETSLSEKDVAILKSRIIEIVESDGLTHPVILLDV